VLFGDSVVQSMQYSIRRVIASRVTGLTSKFNQLFTIGIRTGTDGKLSIKDTSRFEEALRNNLDDVIDLFADSGNSSSSSIEFVSAGNETRVGEDYEVDITQAATRGVYRGSGIADPTATPLTLNSSNNRLKFTINGVQSDDIILSEKTYNSADELVRELQDKIDSDPLIGNRGLSVEWVESGSGIGYLELTSSTYGSGSKVGIVTSIPSGAFALLGLASGTAVPGQDVEGTINGEAAEGSGQYLTGKEGNATTEGLKLRITLDADRLTSGSEGTITLSKGVASNLQTVLDSLTKVGDGMIDRRIRAYQNQIEYLKERVTAFDERLVMRRERLALQFQRMEQILGQLNAQGDYLTSQLANINANWVRTGD